MRLPGIQKVMRYSHKDASSHELLRQAPWQLDPVLGGHSCCSHLEQSESLLLYWSAGGTWEGLG